MESIQDSYCKAKDSGFQNDAEQQVQDIREELGKIKLESSNKMAP